MGNTAASSSSQPRAKPGHGFGKSNRPTFEKLLGPKQLISKGELSHRKRLRAPLTLIIPNDVNMDDGVLDGSVRRGLGTSTRRCMSLDLEKAMEMYGTPSLKRGAL